MAIANMSVKTRLWLIIGGLLASLVIVGSLGMRELHKSNDTISSMFHDRLMPTVWISNISANMHYNVIAFDDALATGEADAIKAFKDSTVALGGANDALWKQYDATVMAPGEEDLAKVYRRSLLSYRATRNQITEVLSAGELEKARRLRRSELQPLVVAMNEAGDNLMRFQERVAHEADEASDKQYLSAQITSWSVMLVALAFGGLSSWLLVRSMMSALGSALRISERIAAGELGQNVQVRSNDEFGRLLGALRDMDKQLSEIVGTVRVSASAVGTAARQISSGNDDLSQRTQEQAAAVEETASSMEQMTATVKQNADNARQASQLATSAREQAGRGGEVAGRAVGAMAEINTASRRIADIIAVIDEIAFQTNLLALNAAVEAARAGEQGRGFAVVATEVRNLAQRSATAAKEIKGLIGDSVAKVAAGTELVDESGKSLIEIVSSVKKVADIVAEITAASEEQARGIDQVNKAVSEIDSVTQQNAALVEEASAASKSMEHQAQALVEKIGFFRAGEAHSQAGVAESGTQTAPSGAVPRPTLHKPGAVRARAAKPHAVAPQRLAKASGDDSSWSEF